MRAGSTTWWQQAVFYEIYIRSFQDSDDDGVGDLNGVRSRLPYLEDLGIDAVWITPFYPSPQVDFGYDVADHEDVDRAFGTLDDFDRLCDEVHGRGMRIVLDVILNHTSDQHPFFLESRRSRTSPYRDWYVWRDGALPGQPPNNWESAFGGSAWTYDAATDQWYYHFFYPQQPDLNWRNPAVERRMLATLAFWLDRGVDGFRLDAVNTLYEDPALRDNPPLAVPRVTLTGVYTQAFVHTRRLPEVHDALRRVRSFVEQRARDAILISEAYVDEVAHLVQFYGQGDEMHLPFNFFLAQVPSRDAAQFRRAVESVEQACGERWPTLVLNNHDIARACDRYGDPRDSDAVAKLLAMMLLTLRGTPFLYYGEELAMRTHDPADLEDVRDPVGRHFWPLYKGRDGARRPMAWDASPAAGFTRGTPWLSIAPDATERNVHEQVTNPASVLRFYRTLLHMRRASPALQEGDYHTVRSHLDVFAYSRQAATQLMVVCLNMADAPREAALDAAELNGSRWQVVLGTHRDQAARVEPSGLRLAPFEALLMERL
jgi:alpha-glucosidase